MWSTVEIFSGLLPACGVCGAAFDSQRCAPFVLPCAHTFCSMCLSKDTQKKKKKCLQCNKKYTSPKLNTLLAETIDRVSRKRRWLEEQSTRCDECDSRRPIAAIRRCLTCEQQISQHISTGLTMECSICLDCCVTRHNGHEFLGCQKKSQENKTVADVHLSSQSSRPGSQPPVGCSTPRLGGTSLSISSSFRAASPAKSSSSWSSVGSAGNNYRRPLPKSMRLYPHLPATPERIEMGGIVCEESSVYQSMSPLESPSSSPNSRRSVGSAVRWMSRLTSLARRWSSTSSEGTDGQSRRNSEGDGEEQTQQQQHKGSVFYAQPTPLLSLHDLHRKYLANSKEAASKSAKVYLNDQTSGLSSANGNSVRRLHYVNVNSQFLDAANDSCQSSSDGRNRSYDYISSCS